MTPRRSLIATTVIMLALAGISGCGSAPATGPTTPAVSSHPSATANESPAVVTPDRFSVQGKVVRRHHTRAGANYALTIELAGGGTTRFPVTAEEYLTCPEGELWPRCTRPV
jgi:hypothetical protein